MKKSLILLAAASVWTCLLSPVFGNDVVLLKHQFYESTYSTAEHIPLMVEYVLRAGMVNCANHLARAPRFSKDPLVPEATNVDKDYVRSGYDRGHNMPAADNACDETGMHECFYLSNVFPQTPSLNRGVWERLEQRERTEAMQEDSIHVSIGGIGRRDPIGADNVGVPRFCWKVIYRYKTREYACFIFPNDVVDSMDPDSYAVSTAVFEDRANASLTSGHVVLKGMHATAP